MDTPEPPSWSDDMEKAITLDEIIANPAEVDRRYHVLAELELYVGDELVGYLRAPYRLDKLIYLYEEGHLPAHEGNQVTVTIENLAANIEHHRSRSFKDHVAVTAGDTLIGHFMTIDEKKALRSQQGRNVTVFGAGDEDIDALILQGLEDSMDELRKDRAANPEKYEKD